MTFIHRFEPGLPEAPTLLLLHGTGGDENDLISLGRQLSPRSAMLAPRGQVLEQGMPRFFRRFAPGILDQEDLLRSTRELADFVSSSAHSLKFDPGRVIAVGLSNGANIGVSLLLGHPRVLRAAILFRPMVPFEPEKTPTLREVPVLILSARRDPMVPSSHPERLKEILERAGADVTLNWSEGGHEITPSDIEAARQWLENRPPRAVGWLEP